MVQWSQYQDTRNPVSPSNRKYNLNDYVCYVCTIKTYRKRIRALRVVDFPFLRQHKPAKGTITMENGDMAAVCLDCFETLKNQFVEQATKYGIPVERRQYNWMQIPPPPEEAATHLTTPKERLEKQIINENVEGGGLAHTSHQGAGLQGQQSSPSSANPDHSGPKHPRRAPKSTPKIHLRPPRL